MAYPLKDLDSTRVATSTPGRSSQKIKNKASVVWGCSRSHGPPGRTTQAYFDSGDCAQFFRPVNLQGRSLLSA